MDVKKICQERDKNKCPCDLETSCDAGRSVTSYECLEKLEHSEGSIRGHNATQRLFILLTYYTNLSYLLLSKKSLAG